MEWLSIPLMVFAFAFILHGFPNIKIGGSYSEVNNYYNNEEEEEDDDDE